MLQGIAQRIEKAERIQEKFNSLSPAKRIKAFLRHWNMMLKIMNRYRLSCTCDDCGAIMDSFRAYEEGCILCGSPNIVSEYYC